MRPDPYSGVGLISGVFFGFAFGVGGIGAAALCGGGGQGDALLIRVP